MMPPPDNGLASNNDLDVPVAPATPTQRTSRWGRRRGGGRAKAAPALQTPRGVRPGKVFMFLLPLFLIAIMGLSAAPVAGIHEGWAKYYHRNIAYQTPGVLPGPITLHIRVGWLRSHNSFQDIFHQAEPAQVPKYTDNKDIRKSGEIIPAVCVAWLLLSALVALLYFLTWLASLATAGRAAKNAKAGVPRTPFVTSLFWSMLAPVLGLGSIGLCIATYIILAVGTALYTRENLGGRVYIAWPDWAWYLGMASGLFWLLLFPVIFGANISARKARRMVAVKGPTGDVDERRAPPFNAPVNGVQGTGHHAGAWNDKQAPQAMNNENLSNGQTNYGNGHATDYTNGHANHGIV